MSDEGLVNLLNAEIGTDGDYLAFLDQAGRGCVAGRVSDWPQLKPACKYAFNRIDELTKERDELREVVDIFTPDVLEAWNDMLTLENVGPHEWEAASKAFKEIKAALAATQNGGEG